MEYKYRRFQATVNQWPITNHTVEAGREATRWRDKSSMVMVHFHQTLSVDMIFRDLIRSLLLIQAEIHYNYRIDYPTGRVLIRTHTTDIIPRVPSRSAVAIY